MLLWILRNAYKGNFENGYFILLSTCQNKNNLRDLIWGKFMGANEKTLCFKKVKKKVD